LRVGKRRDRADIAVVSARYAIGAMIAAVLLALPTVAEAKQSGPVASVASQQCAQKRADVGRKTFRKRYGAKHTMRNCIKRTKPRIAAAVTSATDGCQLELAQSGPDQFILDWAWDEDTVDNAMSECIDAAIDDLLAPDDSGDDESDDEL
jgi:hypothetical protein